uniref:AAA+ ATPase domain-containing protein n=1 Tax=viral metagenome TaxID=1070528 RepID=A0A6C0DJ94_9ZZZZ
MENQLKKHNRMTRAEKEEKTDRPKVSSRNLRKKRGGRNDDDDDELDSKGNIRGLIAYSEESEEETPRSSKKPGFRQRSRKADAEAKAKTAREQAAIAAADSKKKRGFLKKKHVVESDSEEETSISASDEDVEGTEDEEDDDVEGTDDEDDDEDYDDEWDEDDEETPRKMILNFGFGGADEVDTRMVPKRYKIKKETEDVQKFFKLMTEPIETETIDDHIDQFKALKPDEQKRMLTALENRPKAKEQPVMFKILNMQTTPEIQAQLMSKYNNLQALDPGSGEYYKMRNWLEKATALPLGIRKQMPVKVDDGPEVCSAFMSRAKRCLDEAIFGQDEAKLQILQFIAGKITNPQANGMSLLLIGPPGIGKTSLIKQGIAKALDWPFQFISLGGDSDASTFNGHQMVYEGSHCGKIVNSLVAAKSMSMVLMFDELDKISSTPKGEEIQNLLVHLTDSAQNMEFEDKYLSGIPLDMSQSMFVFSANDINKIDRVLLDRFTVINLEGYGPKEKIEIAEKFLLPGALKQVNLAERVGVPKDIVSHVLETYAKEEKGVRELKRCMEQIAQKLNMLRLFNSPDLPFYIKDFALPFILKKEHVDKFLKERKRTDDLSHMKMYT